MSFRVANLVAPVVLCVLFLFGLSDSALAAQRRDGHWWEGLTPSEKVFWAVGFLEGESYTSQLAEVAFLLPQADPQTHKWSYDRAKILEDAAGVFSRARIHDFKNLTAGQLTDGLDKVYGDYRNQSITILEAIPVVLRSIDGTSDDELNQLLERKRKEAAP